MYGEMANNDSLVRKTTATEKNVETRPLPPAEPFGDVDNFAKSYGLCCPALSSVPILVPHDLDQRTESHSSVISSAVDSGCWGDFAKCPGVLLIKLHKNYYHLQINTASTLAS